MSTKPPEITGRRGVVAITAVTVLAILAAHVAVRLLPIADAPAVDVDRPLLNGSDSYFHVHRTVQQLDSFPRASFFDPFMAHPRGAAPEWSIGFDYLFASALAVPKWLGASTDQLVDVLPFAVIFISLIGLWVFYRLARRYLPISLAALATACYALNLAYISTSAAGNFDHHVFEPLGVTLLMLAPHLLAETRARAFIVWFALGLVAVLWCSTLTVHLAILFFAIWLTLRVVNSVGAAPKGTSRFAVSAAAGLLVIGAIESVGHGAFFAFSTLSLFHGTAIALLLAGIRFSHLLRPLHLGIAAVATVSVVALAKPDAATWVVSYVAGWDRFVSNMAESQPIFMSRDGVTFDTIHVCFGVLYVVFPVLFLWLRRKHLENATSGIMDPTNLWFSLALLLISLSQKRFAHLAVPGFLLMLFLAVSMLNGRKRVIAAALAACLLLEPIAFFGRDGLPGFSRYGVAAAAISNDMAPSEKAARYGIMAPPNMGSALLYFTGLPVVSNTFFYKRYLKTDLELRRFTSDREMVAFLRRNRVRYLVAADDVRYRTMLLELFDRNADAEQSAEHHFRPCSPFYLQYAYDRLTCSPGSIKGLAPIRRLVLSTDTRALMRHAILYRVD